MTAISVVEVEKFQVVEVVDERHTVVEIAPVTTAVLEVVAAGPQGVKGDRGAAANAFYEHAQVVPSFIWTVIHNFGARPAGVQVEDSDGNDVEPRIIHSETNANAMILLFAKPTAGIAYIS